MKAAFHTLGCKVNSYETQAISEQFTALGFDIVEYDQPADVYIVNTCAVTKEAARKSRQILNRAKKKNPQALTVAAGCYAQEAAETLGAFADLVIGNNEKSRIAQIVKDRLEERKAEQKESAANDGAEDRLILIDDLTRCYEYEEQEISNQGSHVRAYVKIQDGCNRFCSYCIIPYLRGRSRSRSAQDVLTEVKRLADAGYQEVVLTGIDISDFRMEEKTACESLIGLLELIDEIPGIQRIRLGSLEEGILTEDFVQRASKLKHLCPQFHLSLQSGSDSVLKRMNRKYNTQQYYEVVRMLREYFPNPAITTDLIVGFPGETEEEFEQTLAFAQKVGFSAIHVFKYSRRPGTVADRMEGQLTDRQKTKRSDRLLLLAEQMGIAYRKQFVGQEKEVLFEERVTLEGAVFQTGFTPEYFKVAVRTDEDWVNQIRSIHITEEMLADPGRE